MTQDDDMPDEQDQSETFDETRTGEEDGTDILVDEDAQVRDFTRKPGDAAPDDKNPGLADSDTVTRIKTGA
ncbi:hypothetical protein [Brevundimonas sp. A19_0]|uniref:hypothetical protein n=1 Tax=Brevundimonas sp. A19_0 TaxID=2821087 RepID=UPI001ADCB049|nr:hypothetical protein [Brevundimonas sp. A19_0]MBO9501804.1 hypothetical protein [Brevundimonas sp. A19_0]